MHQTTGIREYPTDAEPSETESVRTVHMGLVSAAEKRCPLRVLTLLPKQVLLGLGMHGDDVSAVRAKRRSRLESLV